MCSSYRFLNYFKELSPEEITSDRKNKFLKIGRNEGFMSSSEDLSNLKVNKNNFDKILKSKKLSAVIAISFILIILILLFF